MVNVVTDYIDSLDENSKEICIMLHSEITANLTEAEGKIWHGHPVWFIQGNPIVGFSRLRAGVQLLFWSGADFDDTDLLATNNKFKAAAITYISPTDVELQKLREWITKAKEIQWDYKNLIKHKGELRKLE